MSTSDKAPGSAPHRSEHGAWDDADAQALLGQLMGTLRRYGAVFIDLGGRVRGWSEGCHAITGFAADDVLGHPSAVLFTPEDVARELHLHETNSARLLNQVVVNLLNNAIKFTPDGGRVTLLANVDQTHFMVRVQDTGRGISAELQPRLFTMFTQADPLRTGRGQGLGIGLALVKQLVSLHHGSVEVRSEGAGRGSEFLVRIPLEQPVAFAGRDGDDAPSPA